jgi:hypothetical protein
MPSLKVCIWNIQNYGSLGGSRSTAKYGVDSTMRNRFIRDFVRQKQIDILLIMEVSSNAQASLQDLMRKLNGPPLAAPTKDWCYAFCGSSLVHAPVTSSADVGFATDARHEGYAVLWRSNQAARFAVVPPIVDVSVAFGSQPGNGRRPASAPLNFVVSGRPTGYVNIGWTNKRDAAGNRVPIRAYRPLGGYTATGVYPFQAAVRMNNWPDLDMPTTGAANPSTLSLTGARRPVYIVVDLANGGADAQRLCPVGAYHAPSNVGQAGWGAMMTGLSRELYVTNQLAGANPDPAQLVRNAKAVLGGDYNFEVSGANWPSEYDFYTTVLRQTWTGGADTRETPLHTSADTDRRTTVRLLDNHHTTPITGANTTDYLILSIDLVFTRPFGGGATDPTAQRVNVLDDLLADAGGGVYGTTLQALHAQLTTFVSTLPNDGNHRMVNAGAGPEKFESGAWSPLICGSWGAATTNWNAFMNRLNFGRFISARRAAEYYHMFVSDHLPLVVDIPI